MAPEYTGCAGNPTWNAWLCDCVLTVPGAHDAAAAAHTEDGFSAREPASLGICHTWPVCCTSTILYAPGWSDCIRRGALVGSEASRSAGRTTTVTRSVITAGAFPPACGCSAARNGVGSIAAGMTCVAVWCVSGETYWVSPVGSDPSSRTRKTRGQTSGRPSWSASTAAPPESRTSCTAKCGAATAPAGNEFACARRSKRTGVTWSAGICAGVAASTPNGGGGANGRSAYACTMMLPLLIDASPLQTTFPLMLLGGSATCASNVTVCACDSTWNCVPREFGSVQTWPVFSITTTW